MLLTDIATPGLNGYQLGEAGMSLRPAMRGMLITGYADEALPEALLQTSIPVLL